MTSSYAEPLIVARGCGYKPCSFEHINVHNMANNNDIIFYNLTVYLVLNTFAGELSPLFFIALLSLLHTCDNRRA